MDQEDLAARLASLEARVAIQEALSALDWHWDAKDAQGAAAYFTEDGVADLYNRGAATPTFQVSGRAALATWAAAYFAEQLQSIRTRHLHTDIVFVALSADSATTTFNEWVVHYHAETTTPELTSTNLGEFTWRREAGEWRVAHGTLRMD